MRQINSIDIFAETNPAFCSLILLSFCEGYEDSSKSALPFPLLIFPIPIILSGDLLSTFEGTNVKTGFFAWVKNNPNIHIQMTKHLQDSNEYIKPALEFAIWKKIIGFTNEGLIVANKSNASNYKNVKQTAHYFKFSHRLGHWFGEINSVKTIFNHLGIHI